MPSGTLIVGETKPMSGFKASVGRLTLLLEVNDFKLRPVLVNISENPRDIIMLKLCLRSVHGATKPGRLLHCSQHG